MDFSECRTEELAEPEDLVGLLAADAIPLLDGRAVGEPGAAHVETLATVRGDDVDDAEALGGLKFPGILEILGDLDGPRFR